MTQLSGTPLDVTSGGGNTVTAPGGGASFVSVMPPAGQYRLTVVYILTGTAETQLTNVKIKTKGANLISGLPAITGTLIVFVVDRVDADGTNPIQLAATNAATGGAIYTGALFCSPVAL